MTSRIKPRNYVDQRGWKYKVMGGISTNTFKARYNKPGKTGWKGCTSLPWVTSFDQAQADLDALAQAQGWSQIDE
jgi:hypothetical protein